MKNIRYDLIKAMLYHDNIKPISSGNKDFIYLLRSNPECLFTNKRKTNK